MVTLRAGIAEVDITPALGHNLAGWIDVRPATRQASPILARALALATDQTRVVLIACDLVGIGEDVRQRIESAVAQESGLSPKHLFVLPSHNHYGPSVYGSYADSAERTAQEAAYTERLIEQLVDAALISLSDLHPAQVSIGYGLEEAYFCNSRFWRKDGTINWVGQRDTDFARDSGPFDPQVGVVCIADIEGNAIAVLYNVACHANAAEEDGFTAISWDWPGYASQVVGETLGGTALFLPGACGNVHPVREPTARLMGTSIGSTVVETARRAEPFAGTPLVVWQEEIVLPARNFGDFDPRQIELICAQLWDDETRAKVQNVFMQVLTRLQRAPMPDHMRSLRVLVVGELALVFIPGEPFAELGLEIKRCSPFTHTFVVEALSESLGYILTRQAYAEGGYQPCVGTRLAPGGGELIVERALALLIRARSAQLG